ncbi:hypothetical protein ACFQY9_12310 [Microvirga aerilata]|uniref:hypothetical protein n=1 Tax=Microvirga aerilata TaxID=670292 RepID=UPI003626A74C
MGRTVRSARSSTVGASVDTCDDAVVIGDGADRPVERSRMRIRNKILLAMSVPIGLLVVQVIAVNHFVRELQSAASFIASAHEAIEADFDALDLVGKLRQEVRKLPSGAVAGQATSLDSRSTRQELWDRLDRAVGAVTNASAAREVDPQQFQALRAALDQARKDYARSEELATLAKGDINSLIQGAIYADRALLALEGALNSMTVELRRELQEAVDHERSIHDRPVIAGIVIGGSAVLFLLAFAWLYADRHLAGRLLALSRSMLAIAAGNLRTPCRTPMAKTRSPRWPRHCRSFVTRLSRSKSRAYASARSCSIPSTTGC